MSWNMFRQVGVGLAAAAAIFLAASSALADKIILKSGKVIECKIVREEAEFWVIEVNGVSDFIAKSNVRLVERDEKTDPAPQAKPAETKPADAKPEEKKADPAPAIMTAKKPEKSSTRATSGATRVAILNFGMPSNTPNRPDDMVGVQCNVQAWKDVIPLLEKDNVDVVVVYINSGGGLALETPKFHQLYEREYKKRWRTVAWVESAISAAAMSPYVLEEFYFLPEGNLGACTMFSGPLILSTGWGLVEVLHTMEDASRMGKRDSAIMRSMQIPEALSCNIDEYNNVSWFQNDSGKYIVNPAGQILTLNANDAVKYRFAKGIAATKEELAKAMGLNEVEWVGKAASDFMNRNIRDNDRAFKKWQDVYVKYGLSIQAAMALRGPENRDARVREVGVAKRFLNEMERMLSINPNLPMMSGIPNGWFDAQRELIKELLREE